MRILNEVQETDRNIYALRDELEVLPEEVAVLQQRVEAMRKDFRKKEEELKKIQLKQKEQEVELQTKEENVKKYQAQLTQVKTNKEYTALQAEINSLKADNSMLEEKIIEFFDTVDANGKETDRLKGMLTAEERALQEKTKEVEEKKAKLKNQISELEKKKSEQIKNVNPEIAALYEKIVKLRNGLALVQVQGDTCPACQIQLRPQVLNELKLKEKIVVCENCSRILFE